jgi:hypothetical protein
MNTTPPTTPAVTGQAHVTAGVTSGCRARDTEVPPSSVSAARGASRPAAPPRRAYFTDDKVNVACHGHVCGDETCTGPHAGTVLLVFPCGDLAVQTIHGLVECGTDDVAPLDGAP